MASIKKGGNFMSLPMNIKRSNPIPVDTTEVWYSLASAQTYATSSATAYVGQALKVVDETNGTTKVYVIKDTAGNLEEIPYVGAIPTGFNISATGAGDDVITVTPTGGTNSVGFTVTHADAGPNDGYSTDGYAETMDSASISVNSITGVKIPRFVVDVNGHVNKAGDQEIKITASEASASASGLMSSAMYTKLDEITAISDADIIALCSS